jgi:hypothetical protein
VLTWLEVGAWPEQYPKEKITGSQAKDGELAESKNSLARRATPNKTKESNT